MPSDPRSRPDQARRAAGSNAFEERGGECIRYWRSEGGEHSAGRRILDELVMASAVTMVRTLTGREDLAPNWVAFPGPPPADPGPYEALFRCPLRFEADAYAIGFDASDLDRQIRRGHPQLRSQLDELCEGLLVALSDDEDPGWLRRCRSLVVAALEDPPPDLSAVAAKLGMSPSTLRKRLAERSTTFRTLVDEIRQELAVAYLKKPDLSLVDVAYLLGFSEQSAFQRAFKRWAGMTPGEYRSSVRDRAPGS